MTPLTPLLRTAALATFLVSLSACSTQSGLASNLRNPESWPIQQTQEGKASFYSTRCNRGSHTASGQRLQNDAATAAHKTLPMGTKVRVVNLSNGMSEVVTINDRGPYIRGRVIDVTVGVARRLGFVSNGLAPVRLEVLKSPPADRRS